MTDTLLVLISALAVRITPKGRYKTIAWLLFAEFCVFVGFSAFTLNLEDGLWFDAITAMGSIAFMLMFVIVGARYLAFLSGAIALYHVGVMWLGSDFYYPIMLVFCLLQLGGLIPGIHHGYQQYKSRHSPDAGRRDTGRHYSH